MLWIPHGMWSSKAWNQSGVKSWSAWHRLLPGITITLGELLPTIGIWQTHIGLDSHFQVWILWLLGLLLISGWLKSSWVPGLRHQSHVIYRLSFTGPRCNRCNDSCRGRHDWRKKTLDWSQLAWLIIDWLIDLNPDLYWPKSFDWRWHFDQDFNVFRDWACGSPMEELDPASPLGKICTHFDGVKDSVWAWKSFDSPWLFTPTKFQILNIELSRSFRMATLASTSARCSWIVANSSRPGWYKRIMEWNSID